MGYELPKTQRAVQLVGKDELRFNAAKPVVAPGPRQIVCRVEAVGLCFSDLKLLKQFDSHPRKSGVVDGIAPEVLAVIPSYVPGDLPTVPGHEVTVTVWAVGPGVTRYHPGERYLVQTDYRWLHTHGSNAAFGYDFEGALQEYVLMDERVITSPEGESMLVPVPDHLSASAVALVEPWACVENSYAERQRQSLDVGGRMLVVSERPPAADALDGLFAKYGRPADVTQAAAAEVAGLPDAAFSDIVYLGAEGATVEQLFAKVAPHGLLNLTLCGGRFAGPVATAVGRVHYGPIRIIGTTSSDPAEAMAHIPATSKVRPNERVAIIGAAGPMGVMHTLRTLSLGLPGVSVDASDLDDARLAALERLARPLAEQNAVPLTVRNPSREAAAGDFTYLTVMVPVPALVAQAVRQAAPDAIVNIFAGIPATVTGPVDLNAYVEKRLYFIGTSGSVLDDMRAVLARTASGALDTDLSAAAVCDLEGAIRGIRAVEANEIPGKIVVYPACHGLGLVRLSDLGKVVPKAAARLKDGQWNREAEQALLAARGN